MQTVFERYELKYILTQKQKEKLLSVIEPYMQLDEYGRTTIRNIYYDTDTYQLIRNSIEKPPYKEKLRVRSYEKASTNSIVFVELKKKYADIVYKRRVPIEHQYAKEWIDKKVNCIEPTQIVQEINYFMSYYETLHPVTFLTYEREAFFCKDGNDFRLTLDENILCRQQDIALDAPIYGDSILPAHSTLLEMKCSEGVPLWLTQFLAKEKIYKTSFSKYGSAYQQHIYPENKEVFQHVRYFL